MRKIAAAVAAAIALAAALFVQTPAQAGDDRWTGPDKKLHLAGGAVLGGFGTLASERKDVGFGLGCLAGLAKEISDRGRTGFSARDWGVTCAGALLGAQLGEYFIEVRRRGVALNKAF